jgi:ribosomal protein S18 acetylase RimI-like enzyme
MYAQESEENRLKALWATYSEVPALIEKAAQQTGEDNVWQNHNFVLTPTDMNWFNHLQITAQDIATGNVVGFCEVAMLSNPSAFNDACRITTTTVVLTDNNNIKSEDDDDKRRQEKQFSPGITNLATSANYRRRGIGTRLLRHVERFVAMYWKAERLGLFVEKDNDAAIALYTKLGYQSEATCDGGDILGELWYMVKDLTVMKKVSQSSVEDNGSKKLPQAVSDRQSRR